jgi:LuxR family maltose regulon positive regulatory protein
MPEHLLTTKLYIPPTHPNLVSRPRLIARLDEGLRLGRKLTLVSAPAGFGKTTLLSAWVHHIDAGVGWLALDEEDNDPARFWAYVIAALQTVTSDIGESVLHAFQAPQPLPMASVLTPLINEIAARPNSEGPYVLVLDDYHLITTVALHNALTFLLDHLPPNFHMVIATRADPPLPLARLRGRGQLTELRQADLRFTAEEATTFLARVSGRDLAAEAIAALEERTEGWITGLQLAALSMRGREDIASFVSAFAGSHRYVLDYLTEEVLQRQPEAIQAFLLQTAILDRLSGPLCNAVLRTSDPESEMPLLCPFTDAQAVLEQLEAANLFLVPLDDRRGWYRYHRLFADLLRARLEDLHPDRVPILHRRASAWYEQEKLLDDAMKHAIAAGDLACATRIVETHGRSLLMRGELTTLLRWIAALPQESIAASARICVTHAWALLLTGQMHAVEARLQRAEHLLAALPNSPLLGDIAVIRAYSAAQQGDVTRTIALANLALERLPLTKQGERGVAFFVLGGAYLLNGDWAAAGDAMTQAAAVGQQGENLHIAVPALNALADIQATQGHLHQAQATAEAAIHLVTGADGQSQPVAAGALAALAELAYEWNDLEGALAYVHQSVELGRLWGNSDTLAASYLTLADVLMAHGDLDEACDVLQEAEHLSQEMTVFPSFSTRLGATRARLWLAQGDWAAAARWAENVSFDTRDVFHAKASLVLARVRVTLGQYDDALRVVLPLVAMAQSHDLTAWRIEGLALEAWVRYAQGEEQRALATLAEALTLAEPEGYVRRFVDLGPALAPLLQKAAARGIVPDYTGNLLAASDLSEEMPLLPQAQPLIEPLSPRELEVLALVAEGLSNRQVGQRLHIAESTVKSHLNTIYGKLGVENRTQATVKARSLRLLT